MFTNRGNLGKRRTQRPLGGQTHLLVNLLLQPVDRFGVQNAFAQQAHLELRQRVAQRIRDERPQVAFCALTGIDKTSHAEGHDAPVVRDALRTGNRCVVDCDSRLVTLFARSFPEIQVVSGLARAQSLEAVFAAHLPSGSLPALFRPSESSFAAATSSYLISDSMMRNQFRAKYADGRPLIGIAWQTNNQETGRERSLDLSLLAPLLSRPDLRFVSLQYGDFDSLEDQALRARAHLVIDRTVDQLTYIDRFAAQVAAMDMVITIDNSTAHMAGALGVPVWVLLPHLPEWRWMLDREDSPWYPTMRLLRQRRTGDWKPVIARLEEQLGCLSLPA